MLSPSMLSPSMLSPGNNSTSRRNTTDKPSVASMRERRRCSVAAQHQERRVSDVEHRKLPFDMIFSSERRLGRPSRDSRRRIGPGSCRQPHGGKDSSKTKPAQRRGRGSQVLGGTARRTMEAKFHSKRLRKPSTCALQSGSDKRTGECCRRRRREVHRSAARCGAPHTARAERGDFRLPPADVQHPVATPGPEERGSGRQACVELRQAIRGWGGGRCVCWWWCGRVSLGGGVG